MQRNARVRERQRAQGSFDDVVAEPQDECVGPVCSELLLVFVERFCECSEIANPDG